MSTTAQPKQKPIKRLTPKQEAELKELAAIARQVRGAHYGEEKEKQVRRYTDLLFKYWQSGVPYSELSRVTGLKWRSIKARFQRHGKLNPPPSQENKVFKGPKTPGPRCDHDKSRFRERVNNKTKKVVHIECLDCRRNKRVAREQEQASLSA